MLRNSAFNWWESVKIVDPNNPKSVQKTNGIEIVRLSPDCQQTWKTVSWRLADAYSQKDANFGAMWTKMKNFMNAMAPYDQLTTVTYPAGK